MAEIPSRIDFKKPRQKRWGLIIDSYLAVLPYGNVTNDQGVDITSTSTSCYEDCLEQARQKLAMGLGSNSIQVVELVPYDFIMQPRV